MSLFGNILWHVLSLGFIIAGFTYLWGLILTATVVAAPIGLGLMELGKFLFAPFSKGMVDQRDLNISQNQAWKTYSTIIRILYFPFGVLLAFGAMLDVAWLFLTLIGIPAAIVVSKSIGTFFNPVGKKCVPKAVAEEIVRRRGQTDIAKHLGAQPELVTLQAAPALASTGTSRALEMPALIEAEPARIVAVASGPTAEPVSAAKSSGPFCPKCGTENPPGSRFCRKDGTPLAPAPAAEPPRAVSPSPRQIVVPPPAPPDEVEAGQETAKRRSAIPILAVAFVVVLALVGVGYLYWKGVIGNRQAFVATNIQGELSNMGFAGVTVQVDKSWVATVSGNLVGAEARDRVLSNVRSHSEIKSVVDALDVRADSAEIKAMVERVMPELGLPNAHVEVDDNGRVTLSGAVDNDKQRVDAADAVQRLPGVTTVDSRFERSVTWRQRDVNRVLADAGLTQVTASYQDDWTATLSGQVSDNESRERAELLVQTADVNAQVVNNIVVIAPAVEAAPGRPTQSARKSAHEVAATPAPEPPKLAADTLLGTWVTAPGTAPNVAAAIEFTDVSDIGHRGGTVKYKKSGCEFRLELVSAQDTVIQYQEKQGNALKKLLCGTGTLVKIELRGPAQATATASNPKTGRVLGSVELVKQ